MISFPYYDLHLILILVVFPACDILTITKPYNESHACVVDFLKQESSSIHEAIHFIKTYHWHEAINE